ncbi:uncharacterized protein BYT42DRAFT_635924 [Radiomyces spectabilis]|uniref:uncharacterized protein n=1 Tax=Radiomyces spectabilis TaxID=64574 RepID=UPI0022210E31|nr:uncharacterized protein BYT42DRAFT_635924 [Radiomyces spectabilis]KAI8379535.1 hypothetical protein BYT42DRAFT_635924 [Radiomyces spectabilis]
MLPRAAWERDLRYTFNTIFKPSTRGYNYPQWSSVFLSLADPYASSAHKNAMEHLKNHPRFLLRIWEGFFRNYSKRNDVTLSASAKTLGKKTVHKLVSLEPFVVNDWSDVPGDVQEIRRFYQENLHKRNQEFAGLNADAIDEKIGTTLTANLVRYSAWLLQKAHDFEAKQWTLLPIALHQVAYVRIVGQGFFHFLNEAWMAGHDVPPMLKQFETWTLRH